tara:strand:- start:2991 stop:3734 length:744 start_codon:yes stop_codon:yes gene_type:complete
MEEKNEIQLDLFEGKILTSHQELEVQQYIEKCKRNVLKNTENNKTIQLLLDEAGFKPGVDYVNTFKVGEVTNNREFGYRYNKTEFKKEVTVMTSSGGCEIIHNVIREGKKAMRQSFVWREGNKLQCTNITSQYRYYKPSSLLAKLKENNERVESDVRANDKRSNILNYTVEKYTKLFPNAKVSIGSDYTRFRNNYDEFKTVIVSFPSGSYVIYRLGYEQDREYLHKKFDKVVDTLKGIDLLNHFNKQ